MIKIVETNDSELFLSEGSQKNNLSWIIFFSILALILFVASIIALNNHFPYDSKNLMYIISNESDIIYCLVLYLLIGILFILDLLLALDIIFREKISFKEEEMKIRYYLFFIPIRKRTFRKHNLKIILETKEDEKKIQPRNSDLESLVILHNSEKFKIRMFRTYELTEKIHYLRLLNKYGINLENDLLKLIKNPDYEDLNEDFILK